MIRITNNVKKIQENFWNNCHFHPTDAIEDAWGKRILDRFADDGSIKMVRMYTMFEDIVTMDEDGKLCYDFRINDLRLDYMIEKGFDILLSYNFMPECIAENKNATSSVSKNKTRYKGKLINTSAPKDYKLWEEVCYTYTKHIVDKYGIELLSKWRFQCFNEPDISLFFMSDLPAENTERRLVEYCKLYSAFENGIRRVTDKIRIGGPALAGQLDFLGGFLDYIIDNNHKLDFISVHNYGTTPQNLKDNICSLSVNNNIENHKIYLDVINRHGFSGTEVIVDEWGAASMGFFNREEVPELMFRETEVYSAYFAKLIYEFIEQELPVSKMLICLSGQHEMEEDFTGFRNFFTRNFIAKPIYNAYILTSRLGKKLLEVNNNNKNIFVISTQNDKNEYSILLTYSSENFKEDLPNIEEKVVFDEDISGKNIKVYCIDKKHTNPYRLYQRIGVKEPNIEELKDLRAEGKLKPLIEYKGDTVNQISLKLSANATFFIEVV